jgi:protocatechuate 3,4-dioxygenase beta subunit
MQTGFCGWCSRRRFLGGLAFGSAALFAPGVFAEELLRTPAQTEGPFYPDKLPLDTDNDLIVINDSLTPSVGEITYVSGRILDARGNPIKNAAVEIWQCDNNGAYLHSGTGNADKKDRNFQGFGRFVTGASGSTCSGRSSRCRIRRTRTFITRSAQETTS